MEKMERKINFGSNTLILTKKEYSFFVKIEVYVKVNSNNGELLDFAKKTSYLKKYDGFFRGELEFSIDESLSSIEKKINSINLLWNLFQKEEELFNSSFSSLKQIIGSAFESL